MKNKIILIGIVLSLCLSTVLMAKEYSLYAYGEKGSSAYDGLRAQINLFEKRNKGVTIKLDTATGQAYHDKLKILSVSNKLPDIMTVWVGKKSSYITSKGLIADIKPFLSKKVRNMYIPSALKAQGKNGEVYVIPVGLTLTGVVFANDKLMKKLGLKYPKTYKEWLGQVKTIQNAGLTPVSVGNKGDWVMNSIVLSAILGRTAGNDWLDKAVNGKASFSDKPFVHSLEIINEMYKKGLLDKATPSWDYNQGTNEFLSSKAVYSMNGGWIINSYEKSAKKDFLKDISLHTFPSIKGEKNKGGVSGILATGLGINAKLNKKDQKVLFELVKIISGFDAEKEAIATGSIPLIKGIKLGKDTSMLKKKLNELTTKSKITYVFDGIVDGKSTTFINGAMNEMFFGAKTPQQVADGFEKTFRKNN